jgi:hypothetical protein
VGAAREAAADGHSALRVPAEPIGRGARGTTRGLFALGLSPHRKAEPQSRSFALPLARGAQPPLGSLSGLARCTFLTFGMTHVHRLRQCLIQYIQHTASIATAIAMVAIDTSVLPLSIARTASISAATAASPLTTKNTISDVLTLFMPA